ncbi:hypothetical protein [Fontibacillus sp. BL9]|uniref:hypothetical protein n=1 Tax=Fontibacillus sp. BL9 TaxID=3389971 RepID=UPI00397E8607
MKKAIFILLLIFISGCSSTLQRDTNESNNKEVTNKNSTEIVQPLVTNEVLTPSQDIQYSDKDIEKIFLPPNFIVKKFDIVHKEKKIEFSMDYIFNEKLYAILNSGITYSFVIVYPEPVQSILNKKNSEIIPGKISSDGRLNYSLSFSEVIDAEISEKQFKTMQDNMEYQLHVLNSKDEVFQIFPTFRYMVDYEEGKSDDLFYK